MQRIHTYAIAGTAAITTVGLLLLAGCGGGNGPLQQQPAGGSTSSPSASAAFLQLLPAAQKSAVAVGPQKCGNCHSANYGTWVHTLHAQNNVTCEACHGNGSVHAGAPATTNILTFTKIVNPAVCAQCHGPLAADYAGSPHATPVADPVQSGSNRCLRCHSAEFRTQYIDLPWSAGQTQAQVDSTITSLSSTVLTSYETSTQETASCADCHDPHAITNNTLSNGSQAQLRRATFNTSTADIGPGAAIATYTNTNHVCGTCHNGWGANPTDATMQSSTSRDPFHEGPQYSMLLGVSGYEETGGPPTRTSSHAAAPDQCVHCHMPGASHTFTVNVDTSCAPCHSPTDAASLETTVQTEIQDDLVAVRTRMQNWAQTNLGNPDLWDYTSNIPSTDPQPTAAQEKAMPLQVKRARYEYYFILLDSSYGIHNVFYTRYLVQVANNELDAINVPPISTTQAVPAKAQVLAILNGDIRRSRAAARSTW